MFGVEFVALMGHSGKAVEIEKLGDDLQARLLSSVNEVIEATFRLNPKASSWFGGDRWEWSNDPFEAPKNDWPHGVALTFDGPAGLVLDFFARAWSLYHTTAWQDFVSNPAIQTPLRKACREMSARFGRPRAIYVPDSLWPAASVNEPLADGMSLSSLEEWLATHVGPPALSIESIGRVTDGEWEGDGYYIDDFHDF